MAEYRRQHYQDHRAEAAEYYQDHRAEIAERMRQYYQDHRAEITDRRRQYRLDHPVEKYLSNQRQQARQRLVKWEGIINGQ